MKNEDFLKLAESIKQAGRIKHGHMRPGRVSKYKKPNISSIRHNRQERELINENEWEAKWAGSLKKSASKTDKLAAKAFKSFKDGKTRQAGFGDL